MVKKNLILVPNYMSFYDHGGLKINGCKCKIEDMMCSRGWLIIVCF